MTGMLVLTLCMMVVGFPSPSLSTSANFCPVDGADYLDRPDGNIIKEYFECPGPDDPPDHTICCGQSCCPVRHIDSVLQVDIEVAMMISITIILISLITAVTLVICCFKYGCPLYDTCSGGYTRRDTLPGCYGTGEYEGSDQDLLTGNGNVKEHVSKAPGKKFYATASDKHINADKAQHV